MGDMPMETQRPNPLLVFAPGLFSGTTGLITGGGRGIGRATALGFARLRGERCHRQQRAGRAVEVAREVESTGAPCLHVEVNIRDVASVERLRDATLDRFGSVDFVINNAGGQFTASPFAISDNGWRAVVDLNLNGTWNMCTRFMPHLMERGRGSIVNIVHIFVFERERRCSHIRAPHAPALST